MAHTQAAASDATATIKLLLTHGAAVDLQDEAGATALLYAAQEGHLAAVFALLRAGANAGLRDGDGATPIQVAAEWQYLDVVRVLRLGADAAVLNLVNPRDGGL